VDPYWTQVDRLPENRCTGDISELSEHEENALYVNKVHFLSGGLNSKCAEDSTLAQQFQHKQFSKHRRPDQPRAWL